MSSTNSTAMARTCKLRSAGLVLCGCEAERKSDEGAARKNAHWLTPGRRSACPTLAPTGRSEADMKLIFSILVHYHPPERFMVLRERRLEQRYPTAHMRERYRDQYDLEYPSTHRYNGIAAREFSWRYSSAATVAKRSGGP